MPNWTRTKPKKPYTLQKFDDYVLYCDLFIAYYYPDGMRAFARFTFDWNWNTVQISPSAALQPSRLGTAWLVRNHIQVNRVVNRFVGGGQGYTNGSRFYDDTLEEKLGGEYQRLGG